MRNLIIGLALTLGIMSSAIASQPVHDEKTTNLSGTWKVSPKDGNYGPTFAIGEAILTQFGDNIEGIYMPSPGQLGIMNCATGPYKISGKVSGRQVNLSAVGPESTLTGHAEIGSGTLSGDAVEVFKSSRCSGAVSGKFVMRRL